jgi:radical SAM superfamily enzyme YgiQ (UPF0313 family)
MKVTFVAIGQEQLGISLLAAVLRREGHETTLAYHPGLFDDRYFLDVPALATIFDRTPRLVEEIVADPPDLLAFSVLTPVYQWSLRVAAAVKARIDVPVIFGGVHPSAVPEVCLENDCVDYVCVGEGEDALVRLCEQLPPAGRRPPEPIPNLCWWDGDRLVRGENAPFLGDLDSLPYFDKQLWEGQVRIADNWMTMASRGCPYRCTFCFNNFFARLPGKGGGRYLRRRSIEHMMGELVEARDRYAIRRVDFQDDIFTTDRQWLRDFLQEYRREIDRPFQCLVHPRYIDEEMARWLRDAGCQHVQMGVQSADEEYKRHQLLRMEKEAHMSRSMAALGSAGLDVKVDHILGLPGEPLSAQEKARELYAMHRPRRIQTFWLTHLPGVELTRSAVERGELSQEDYERVNRGESGRFHTRSSAHAAEASTYRRYQLLFRALPLLPRPLRLRARAHHVPNLSERTANLVGGFLEGLNVVANRDDESINYLRYYAFQLRKQVPEVARDRLTPRGRRSDRQARQAIAAAAPRRIASRIPDLRVSPPADTEPAAEALGGAEPAPVALRLGRASP